MGRGFGPAAALPRGVRKAQHPSPGGSPAAAQKGLRHVTGRQLYFNKLLRHQTRVDQGSLRTGYLHSDFGEMCLDRHCRSIAVSD